MATVGTAAYRLVARAAASQLGRLGFVQGVHARRSLACGEISFGRSDIDLTVVIDPSESLDIEVERLRALVRRLDLLHLAVPMLGPAEVGTPAELEEWYRSPILPASPHRDRGWLRLWGKPFERPAISGARDDERDGALPWFFWAWLTLTGDYRRGRVRTCCNMLLDMVNVYYLYTGAFRAPMRRVDIHAHWSRDSGPSREREQVGRALTGPTPRPAGPSLRWIYAESLRVADALYPHVGRRLDGSLPPGELRTRVPFAFKERVYVLVDPARREQVEAALDRMEREPNVVVATERLLKLYFYHRNPWEYFTSADDAARNGLQPPPEDALRRAIRYYLHRVVPRRIGQAIGTRVDRSETLGPQYAQGRLWLDQRFIAASREQLTSRYRVAYGAWPYQSTTSRDEYFRREYPLTCRAIDDLAGCVRRMSTDADQVWTMARSVCCLWNRP